MLLQIPKQTSTALYADNPNEGVHCCITCKREMLRVYVPMLRKYAIPSACACITREREKEEAARERRNRRDKLERIYSKNIMNERLKRALFENFLPRPGTEEIKSAALRFVRDFESQETGMFVFGSVGNGKSHLMAAVHHELYRQGYVCLFLDCSQLFNIAKDTFKSSSKFSLTDIINAAVNADLLTLDELGSGFITETEFNDILLPIINGRQGKLTNYTSNLDMERLKNWFATDKYGKPVDPDGRVIDRIIGSCDIYQNTATSKRQEDAMKRLQS